MGSCSSREQDLDASILSGNLDKDSGLNKNFGKSLRYNDSDFILFAFNGDLPCIKSALVKKELPDMLSVRGFSQTLQLSLSQKGTSMGFLSSSSSLSELDGGKDISKNEKQLSTKMWNPTLFAVYNNQLEVVKFLLHDSATHVNKLLCLMHNPFNNERQTLLENDQKQNECISLLIAIANKNMDMLQFLINGLYYLWNIHHLRIVIQEIINSNWNSNALGMIVHGRCFKQIFQECGTLGQKLEKLTILFGFVFRKVWLYQAYTDEVSSLDDEEVKKQEQLYQQLQQNNKKWRISICKKFLQSDFNVIFALYLIQNNFYDEQSAFIRNVTNGILQLEENQQVNFTKQELDRCFEDQAFENIEVRNLYDTLVTTIDKYKYDDEENFGIMLLRYTKQGDLLGIQNIVKKVKNINIEEVFDHYGEVEFNDQEVEEILQIFDTRDVSILRRINPLTMALIYNQVDILKFLQEKVGFVLRRRHFKGPKNAQHQYYGIETIFKVSCFFKSYSMFIYLWNNYPHLFKLNDLCEGAKVIIEHKDKILTKHLFTSFTTHQLFNFMSFAFRFQFLSECVFEPLQALQMEKEKNRDYLNALTCELCKQPYSFYSFALFYEKGSIYHCLKSLELSTQRDIRLFVKNNPRSADKFINEIINDEVAMKLFQNTQSPQPHSQSHYQVHTEESSLEIPLVVGKSDEYRIKEQHRIESMKIFRQAMDNLARTIQVELKLLDINEMTKSKTSSGS